MSVDSTSSFLHFNTRPVERVDTPSLLEQAPYTVLAVAGARVYHTKLDSKDTQWNYSQWKGVLTFGRDVDTAHSLTRDVSELEKHWFRLSDAESGRTVWMFKFPENFEYMVDRPFFHVFQGRTRRYGFLFNDDDEAAVFGKKVMTQTYGGRLPTGKKGRKHTGRSKSISHPIKRSMISSPAPQSFQHVSHVGMNKDGLFEASKDIDSSWKSLLSELQGHGVSEAAVPHKGDFVEGFWQGVEAVQQAKPVDAQFSAHKDLTRPAPAVSAF